MRTALFLTVVTGLALAVAPAAEAKSPLHFDTHTGVLRIGKVGIHLGGSYDYPRYYPPAPVPSYYPPVAIPPHGHHHHHCAPQYVVLVRECIHMPWREVGRFDCPRRAEYFADTYAARGFQARVIRD